MCFKVVCFNSEEAHSWGIYGATETPWEDVSQSPFTIGPREKPSDIVERILTQVLKDLRSSPVLYLILGKPLNTAETHFLFW